MVFEETGEMESDGERERGGGFMNRRKITDFLLGISWSDLSRTRVWRWMMGCYI